MFFKYIPEIEILVAFNRQTKESVLYHVPPSTAKRLSFELASDPVESLPPPRFSFQIIEPDPS